MTDEQFLDYCRNLLTEFAQSLSLRTAQFPDDDPLRELAGAFALLGTSTASWYEDGPVLVARLFTTYPELAPGFPRYLLWVLGGDCLHYMADEEIDQFQQLEEMRSEAIAAGEPFNLREARAKLLNLQ